MKDKFDKIKTCISKKDLIIFLIPLLVFSFTLYVFYPGILSFDSYNQLYQINSSIFGFGHPVIHTLFEMICIKMFRTIGGVGIVQILLFSVLWTVICNYNRRKNDTKLLFIIQLIITFLICINPINSIMSITLWKDVLFCYSVLTFSFLLEILIDRKFIISKKYIILLAFFLSLIPNLRVNGYAIFITMTFLTVILLMKKDFKSFNFILFLIAIFSFSFLLNIPTKLLVKNNKSSLGGSSFSVVTKKAIQLSGFYYTNNLLDSNEIDILDDYVNLDDLAEKYNVYFMDPIGNLHVDNAKIKKDNYKLYNMLFENTIEHPIDFLKFEYHNTEVIFAIKRPENAIGTIINTDINAENNIYNIKPRIFNHKLYTLYNRYINKIMNTTILNILFFSSGLYFFMSMILSFVYLFKKKINLLFICLPNIFNSLALILCIPVQDTRYTYSSFLIFYLLIIIITGNLKKEGN